MDAQETNRQTSAGILHTNKNVHEYLCIYVYVTFWGQM